eukprot:scaffold6090_cov79-Cyclotella_meneghiniana.AAC.16
MKIRDICAEHLSAERQIPLFQKMQFWKSTPGGRRSTVGTVGYYKVYPIYFKLMLVYPEGGYAL